MYVFSTLVSHKSIVELVSKEIAFPVQCRTKQTKLRGSIFSSGRLLHPLSPVLPFCLRIARAKLTKILKATTLFFYGVFKFLFKGKLPVPSLVSSLTPNNLIPFTLYLSFVYLSFRIPKTTSIYILIRIRFPVPFRIGKLGSFRIDKIRILPDWQN